MNRRTPTEQEGEGGSVSGRPVLYLDVDDTLLTFHRDYLTPGLIVSPDDVTAAPGAGEFVLWALEHYEVRWLTAWAPRGFMHEEGAKRLALALGEPGLTWERLAEIRGLSWMDGVDKTADIDWREYHAGRPFLWIEDDLLPSELLTLANHGASACYRRVNVTENPFALQDCWWELLRDDPDGAA